MKMLEKIKQRIYEIMTEEDDYEDEEPLTKEDEKLKMFIENPIRTIACIIDSDYITKQELIDSNNNSKIIKYDFKNKMRL